MFQEKTEEYNLVLEILDILAQSKEAILRNSGKYCMDGRQ